MVYHVLKYLSVRIEIGEQFSWLAADEGLHGLAPVTSKYRVEFFLCIQKSKKALKQLELIVPLSVLIC